MPDEEPTLLLTRPELQSKEFLAYCEDRAGRRFSAVIAPTIKVVPVAYSFEPGDARTFIFTSSHAVRQLAPNLAGRQVATVGEATAALAKSFGADAVALGKNVEAFVSRANEIEFPAIYFRGVHISHDLQATLSADGRAVRELVVYDQIETPLSIAGQKLLTGNAEVIAPVFSARSARLLSKYRIAAPMTVLAISDSVKSAWKAGGTVLVAREPTRSGMYELVEAYIRGTHIADGGSRN